MKAALQEIININTNKIECLKSSTKPKIGWFSINTPEGFFYVAGIIPFRISGDHKAEFSDARSILHRNICPQVLACLDEGLAGIYNFMDGIVVTNCCDARVRLLDVWKHYLIPRNSYFLHTPRKVDELFVEYFKLQIRELIVILRNDFNCTILSYFLSKKYGCIYIMLDTPHIFDDGSVSYFVNQLKQTVREIEETIGIEFNYEKFLEVIKYSNEAKKYFSKTIDLCVRFILS